jgi:hypothetical protein
VKDLNIPLGALDNRTRVLARADVVAATIINHDARLVRQNQLSDAAQHVLRDRTSDGPVEHRQGSHLLREVRPELENAAAGKHNAAVFRRRLSLQITTDTAQPLPAQGERPFARWATGIRREFSGG